MNFLWPLKHSIKLKTDQSTKKYAMNLVYIHYNDFFKFTILSLVSYNVVNICFVYKCSNYRAFQDKLSMSINKRTN